MCACFFFSSRRRHTRCALVTGVQTCALPICRVLVQYPKRATQRGVMQADRSHLPLKVNTAGVIPPIFASSLLLMPLTVTQMLGNKNGRAASRERVCQYVAVTEVAVSLKKQNT